jgi:poly(A) polymerase
VPGFTERDYAREVVERLQRAGYQALWAGGCVRDELLGLEPADYDVATNATPEEVQKEFRRSHTFGASFGVVEVLGPRDADGEWLKVQVATFRTDGIYSDGRHPDTVTFSTAEEDAKRRDFTINGMFFDPVAKQVLDYVNGQSDLDARVLRAIGDPVARFTEDKLRVLRAVRMASRFDLAIEPATLAAVKAMAGEILTVSAERIAEELRKILKHPNRVKGVQLLAETGLLDFILPGFVPKTELANLPSFASFEVALATLAPEMTKAECEGLAKRLRLSNEETARITWLITHRTALAKAPTLRWSILKPILAHDGRDELLQLHAAYGMGEAVEFCERFMRDTSVGELNPVPLVTGDDLTALGMKPGREFKRILDAVRVQQLENPRLTKPEALKLVAELR